MCNFFSLTSKGDGKPLYFDWKRRKLILSEKLPYESADSHTSINDYFGLKGTYEDRTNKYEYDPLTQIFIVDQKNGPDDRQQIEAFCRKLNFKEIVPFLIVKPIIHPFKDRKCKRITKEHFVLLKMWDSVLAPDGASVLASVGESIRESVGDSVGASVGESVWDSIRESVWDSVRESIRESVRASVRESIRESVWASVRESIRESVWDSVRESIRESVWAYIYSFFEIPEWKGINPLQPCISLWESGIVPSFDGYKWRLHTAKGIAWEGKLP